MLRDNKGRFCKRSDLEAPPVTGALPAAQSSDPLVHDGPVNTDLFCHNCKKNFIAEIDYAIEGNHGIICCNCGHLHYRLVKAGKVTSDRWDKAENTTMVKRSRIWKHEGLAMRTTTAAELIRERWLQIGRA